MATPASGPNIDFTGRRRRRRRRLARTIAIAAVVVVGGGGYYLLSRGGLPSPFSREPERPNFTFQLSTVKGYQLGEGEPSSRATARVARDVRRDLSDFYIDAFLAPSSWTDGVPDDAWRIFAPAARRDARRNAASFSLGRGGRAVRKLTATSSALQIRVLFDSSGRPQAATATAALKADGRTKTGQRFELRNRSAFVLRPVEGRWLIVGYPNVRTELEPVRSRGGSQSPG
ncbi:MAG: hypothetical protein M3N24_09225, partial [Actinomycetota bacterium]|nr:hypothetical protein [Actinomycetota bacterium]